MSGRPRRLPDEQELDLVRWWNARGTVKAKARELGIPVETLKGILERHGAMRLDGAGPLRPSKGSKRRLIAQYEQSLV